MDLSILFSDLSKQLSEKYDLPLKTGFNSSRGFYLQLQLNRDQDMDTKSLPSEFIKVTKIKSTITCSTVDLVRNIRCPLLYGDFTHLQEKHKMSSLYVTY